MRSRFAKALLLLIWACAAPLAASGKDHMSEIRPPVAAQKPHSSTRHGITLQDPYFWLKDQSYPKVDDAEVLAYLEAENSYFEKIMAPDQPLIETIFAELKGRIKEDDASVPMKDGAWLYWWAFEKGAQYRVWWRKPLDGGPQEKLIDEPALAQGKSYFRLGGSAVSPDGKLIAYSFDDNGSENFQLVVKDIASGQIRATISAHSLGAPVWAADSQSLLWTEVNAQWRPWRVRLHVLGQDPGQDPIIYEEADSGFFVGIGRSTDRQHFIIGTSDHETSEVRLLPIANPRAALTLVRARQKGIEYDVDVRAGTLYIRTNDQHRNFRIATASLQHPDQWTTWMAGSDAQYIRGVTAFKRHLAITSRVNGLDQIDLVDSKGQSQRIRFPEASYTASLSGNAEYDMAQYRLNYQSMVTPPTVFDFDPASTKLTTLKVQDIPSGYDASQYATERLMATARDGTQVPVSIVYRKDFPRDGSGEVHLYAYGAYGYGMPPSFSTARISLLDRGMAYAIAHIRGGDDMGYHWYENGKREKRWNSFHDFIDAAQMLIAKGYARKGHISISGRSAGGQLMGVVVNEAPDMWAAVIAGVPFVDVLNTMQDESLPLTPMEWPEWGNPISSEDDFKYILSYSPYENVKRQAYPPMLVTAGLNDPRVTYWEPAKWVARLRATKTDSRPLLLKTNMGAGHGGKSGRFESLHEVAEEYGFLLRAHGLTDRK